MKNRDISFEYPKNPYLNQATQNNACQTFPTPKKSRNRKFQTQENSSIIHFTWHPEDPRLGKHYSYKNGKLT